MSDWDQRVEREWRNPGIKKRERVSDWDQRVEREWRNPGTKEERVRERV